MLLTQAPGGSMMHATKVAVPCLKEVVMSAQTNVKEQARKMLEQMPEDVSWDQVLDAIRVRRLIEKGLRDVEKGRTVEVDKVRERFGLGNS